MEHRALSYSGSEQDCGAFDISRVQEMPQGDTLIKFPLLDVTTIHAVNKPALDGENQCLQPGAIDQPFSTTWGRTGGKVEFTILNGKWPAKMLISKGACVHSCTLATKLRKGPLSVPWASVMDLPWAPMVFGRKVVIMWMWRTAAAGSWSSSFGACKEG